MLEAGSLTAGAAVGAEKIPHHAVANTEPVTASGYSDTSVIPDHAMRADLGQQPIAVILVQRLGRQPGR